jgi:hypothetical protein
MKTKKEERDKEIKMHENNQTKDGTRKMAKTTKKNTTDKNNEK